MAKQTKPEKYINWHSVDEYLEAGCTGTEISSMLGICSDTLYLRCQKEKEMGFSAYAQQKRAAGDAILRKSQYDEAIGGDRALLIWLGKQRLAQKDNPDQDSNAATAKALLQEIKVLMIDGHSTDIKPQPETT